MLARTRTIASKPRRMGFANGARLLSPRRTLAFVGAALTLLTVARVLVLLIESYSTVWAERAADRELLSLCNSGAGSDSADLRALCLKKRAEQAAPIFLKAILRAVTTAFTDFVETFSSPTRIMLLVLFTLTGVAAPVVKAVSALAVDNLKRRRRRVRLSTKRSVESGSSSSDEEDNDKQTVVVIGGGRERGTFDYGMRRLFSHQRPRLLRSPSDEGLRSAPRIVDLPAY
jgi:hypothetical protein